MGDVIFFQFPVIKFSRQSVIIDFGTNQHKFLTMMSKSQPLIGLANDLFSFIVAISQPVKTYCSKALLHLFVF